MRNLFMALSCMFDQPKVAVYDDLIKWHLKCLAWSLNLNPWLKPTLFKLAASCISSNHNILPCHDHASYCALHWSCFFSVCRCCSPSEDVVLALWSLTLMKTQCYLQKCQASKTPLFIMIQSHSLAPALFYCIWTTTIHLLIAAVAKPLYPLHDLSLPQ